MGGGKYPMVMSDFGHLGAEIDSSTP